MADDATLASVLASLSPAPADNLMVTVDPGPSETPPSPTPDPANAAMLDRIAELERVHARHTQQLNGSRAEIDRYQRLLDDKEQTLRQVLTQQQQLTERLTQPPVSTEPELTLDDLIEKVALEGKKGLGQQWQQQLVNQLRKDAAPLQASHGASAPATIQDMQTLLQQRDHQQTIRQAVLADLGERYKDVVADPAAAALIPEVYAALKNNPLMQVYYPPDPSGLSTITWQGVEWDARLVDRALAEVRAQQQTQQGGREQLRQQGQSTPTQGGNGNGRPPTPKDAVVLPAQYVRGEDALFNDPRIRKALEMTTGLKDPRSQAKWFFDNVPPAVKAQWQRQAGMQDVEVTR